MAELKTGAIDITPVRSARDRRQFLELPYRLYRNHPHWIAPLRIAQKDVLNTRRHPFYKTSDAELFIAHRDGRVVGRIMAIVNHAHNEFHNERVGFFGFFEVEDDDEACRARRMSPPARSLRDRSRFRCRTEHGRGVGVGVRRARPRRPTLPTSSAAQIGKAVGARFA